MSLPEFNNLDSLELTFASEYDKRKKKKGTRSGNLPLQTLQQLSFINEKYTTLSSLTLPNVVICKETLNMLAHTVESLPQLRSLSLSFVYSITIAYNLPKISDILALEISVSNLTYLEKFQFAYDAEYFRTTLVERFCFGLKRNSSLKYLSISARNINENAESRLAELIGSVNIRRLELEFVDIVSDQLVDAIRLSPTISELRLKNLECSLKLFSSSETSQSTYIAKHLYLTDVFVDGSVQNFTLDAENIKEVETISLTYAKSTLLMSRDTVYNIYALVEKCTDSICLKFLKATQFPIFNTLSSLSNLEYLDLSSWQLNSQITFSALNIEESLEICTKRHAMKKFVVSYYYIKACFVSILSNDDIAIEEIELVDIEMEDLDVLEVICTVLREKSKELFKRTKRVRIKRDKRLECVITLDGKEVVLRLLVLRNSSLSTSFPRDCISFVDRVVLDDVCNDYLDGVRSCVLDGLEIGVLNGECCLYRSKDKNNY
ncbi:hypothetical protein HK098_002736 [Nowakowskiella sp. JEL0407]|nr:hypothetical protein HK098_002736 [Nowakowskiella sp. JEL0407]